MDRLSSPHKCSFKECDVIVTTRAATCSGCQRIYSTQRRFKPRKCGARGCNEIIMDKSSMCVGCRRLYSKKRRSVPHKCDVAGCAIVIDSGANKCSEHTRASGLWHRYKITIEQYNAMLTAQKGSCAICFTVEPGHSGYFNVDHSHTTGEIRGLLCDACNKMLTVHFEKHHKVGAEYLLRSDVKK